jgi:hypothetical protein
MFYYLFPGSTTLYMDFLSYSRFYYHIPGFSILSQVLLPYPCFFYQVLLPFLCMILLPYPLFYYHIHGFSILSLVLLPYPWFFYLIPCSTTSTLSMHGSITLTQAVSNLVPLLDFRREHKLHMRGGR